MMDIDSEIAGRIEGHYLREVAFLAQQIEIAVDGVSRHNPDLAERMAEVALGIISSTQGSGLNQINSDASEHDAQHSEAATHQNINIDEFILRVLEDSESTMSIQQIVDALEEADYTFSRPSLVVKLHRLVKKRLLERPSNGHFQIAKTSRTGKDT